MPKALPPPPPQPISTEVWGQHFWYVLHTIAYTYPEYPTQVTKRKYYDLIQNLPIFIPEPKMGDKFAEFLDRYPVQPYLDSRESFMRWIHFIHNRYNVLLGKPQMTFYAALDSYYQASMPRPIVDRKTKTLYRDALYVSIVALLISIGMFYGHRKA
jgi:Erv1 / Alr family